MNASSSSLPAAVENAGRRHRRARRRKILERRDIDRDRSRRRARTPDQGDCGGDQSERQTVFDLKAKAGVKGQVKAK